ncbi:MAG: transposase [Myxococcaceae bacterium]|nr:transposase [Myxococcaceae bacterium]MBH2006213.1 transposase [Myxococcaceae bacterium]
MTNQEVQSRDGEIIGSPFHMLCFREEIRKMIDTTNAVEALHRPFRKVTKAKGFFPTDEALKIGLKDFFRNKRDRPVILGSLQMISGDRVSV